MNQVDEILGFRVYYDELCPLPAHVIGLWRWKRIIVGPKFWALSFIEQRAVLFHEAKHAITFDLDKRLLNVFFYRTKRGERLVAEQEFAADRFAAECGHGIGMVRFLHRCCGVKQAYGPSAEERLERLTHTLREALHVAHAA